MKKLLPFLLLLSTAYTSPLKVNKAYDAAIDGDWRSAAVTKGKLPQNLEVSFEQEQTVYGFVYIPNAYRDLGRIRQYQIAIKQNDQWKRLGEKQNFSTPKVASFWADKNEKIETIWFSQPVKVSAMRLHSFSEVKGREAMSVAEFQPIFDKEQIPFKGKTLAALKDTRMAPSIHMQYSYAKGNAFYTEMKIHQSAKGSFFMAAGFDSGYFGLQEQSNGRKVIIFSVWDKHHGDNPDLVPEDKKVKVVYQNPDMLRVGRFGNEGTGGQSFFQYDWKKGEKYRFYLSMEAKGERNEFTAYFYFPEKKEWQKLVTFSTLATKKFLYGMHHFVEDFKRDFDSAKKIRHASFSNTFYRQENGQWQQPKNAMFTKDSNSQKIVNCKINDNDRHLITGGNTANDDIKLWQMNPISSKGNKLILEDLPKE